MITAKFGGTSLADAQRIRQAAEIIRADPARRYVVVSAPGKRFPSDIKITDQLYRFHATGAPEDFRPIEARFEEIVRELGLNLDLSADFAEMKTEPHNADYMASCGEYLSARIMAAYLDWPFVDTEFCVFFDENGSLDRRRTECALREKLENLPCAVLPGFYGAMPDGRVHTFSRGGSDISGALVAAALGADVYENWTDVDGVLTADPRIVPRAVPVPAITYAELQELACQGATVLHEDAVRPVWDAGIPIHIRNTFNAAAEGTWVCREQVESEAPVTGIAGRKGYSVLRIAGMTGEVPRLLSCLERRHVAIAHMETDRDGVSLVTPTAALEGFRAALEQEIRQAVRPEALQISDGLAIIAIVGRGMMDRPGLAGELRSTLDRAGVNVCMIDMGIRRMKLVIGVQEDGFEAGMRAVYDCFFPAHREQAST